MAIRERRAQARAALTPQPTGSSEKDLIDTHLKRLKLEGTPRVKRERRQPAPPISPLPATTDFSDFMLPSLSSNTTGDVDYGTLAQRMMNDIFAVTGLSNNEGPPSSSQNGPSGRDSSGSSISPSPVVGSSFQLPSLHDQTQEHHTSPDNKKVLPSLPEVEDENGFDESATDDEERRDSDSGRYEDEDEDEDGEGDRTVVVRDDTPIL